MKKITPKFKTIKKAISQNNEPGSWGLAKYSFSPYEACQHGCRYCDGRAEKYYVEGDFEKDIQIRENLPKRLEKELPKLREKGLISIGSGITDPYQPIEKETKIMKKSAEILTKHDFAASILTKSSIIQRDLKIWSEVNKNSKFILYMTITFLEENLREILEPNASPIYERLETLKKYKKAGCGVGVLLMPIIPILADSEKQLVKLIETLKAIKVDFILPGTLTLRPGKQKRLFLKTIEKHFPKYLSAYKSLYRENRQSGAAVNVYQNEIYQLVGQMLKFYKIPDLPPHRLYRDFMPNYDEIAVLLAQMEHFYKYRGINIKRLSKARHNYQTWLNNEKKIFRRKRSLPNSHLEETFLNAFDFGIIRNFIKNDLLYDFIKKVVFERKIFDPVKMKLVWS